ncbi:hypothetical protein H4Q26_018378, partial [Puccinia striiformis f. sp. tritici PST-130]
MESARHIGLWNNEHQKGSDNVESNLSSADATDSHTPPVPASDNPRPETPTPRLTRSAASANSQSTALPNSASTPLATAIRGTDARWALGGVTGTVPARGPASLSTHMNFLGRPVSSASINLNPEGWVVAERLKFNHQDARGREYEESLCGSSQDRWPQRRPTSNHQLGGKVGIHDEYPTINPHATKARMYKACGHVLRAFQLIINRCTSLLLNDTIRQKIKAFE